ncbi:hypothetical protein C8Q74DRAFT_1000809 [Fomes fomentarius]|nr:hypothetical protein C8Q74DRAFT_1000809 [Fomes fomentarius]
MQTLGDSQRRAVYDSEKPVREHARVDRHHPDPEDEADITASMPGYIRVDPTPFASRRSTSAHRYGPEFTSGYRWAHPGSFEDSYPSGARAGSERWPGSGSVPSESGGITAADIAMLHFCVHPGLLTFFDDEPRSLYATFRPVFARIAQDEPGLEGAKLPSFGTLRTPWSRRSSYLYASGESVGEFYGAWMSFETSKEFEHEAGEIPDSGDTRSAKKRTRAKMKKIRTQARKEYNNAVRSLVLLVRNHDPRYICRNGCLCMGCFARHLAGMRR